MCEFLVNFHGWSRTAILCACWSGPVIWKGGHHSRTGASCKSGRSYFSTCVPGFSGGRWITSLVTTATTSCRKWSASHNGPSEYHSIRGTFHRYVCPFKICKLETWCNCEVENFEVRGIKIKIFVYRTYLKRKEIFKKTQRVICVTIFLLQYLNAWTAKTKVVGTINRSSRICCPFALVAEF